MAQRREKVDVHCLADVNRRGNYHNDINMFVGTKDTHSPIQGSEKFTP